MPASSQALHLPSGRLLASHLAIPRTFIGRVLGLMFHTSLPPDHGMFLNPCNGIHMLFVPFALDCVFLDRHRRVKKIFPRVHAWVGAVWFVWGAQSVIELPAGTAQGLQVGDQIVIQKVA